jgi:predicted phage terminase large subunit-like protein
MLPGSEEFSQAEIGQELLRRRLATDKLLNFTTFTKPDYQVNWHHELMFKKLDEFISGKIKRLIISCPPRNGKSEIVSRRLPAYLFGKIPTCQIIACSYSADLAQRMNRDVQRIIDSPEYHTLFPDVGLNASNVRTTAQGSFLRNSDIFEIVGSSGVYRSSGIGGGITGMGFNFGLIDDYCKNREEAESSTVRDKVYEWYTDVFLTRAEKDASILITATRWHEDDLIGRLLKLAAESQDADQWDIITLPALSEETRPDYDQRTGEDQPLWPDKYPIEALNKIKATVPIYTWLSLYQQRPSAADGNLFKREHFKYCTQSGSLIDMGDKKVLLNQCKIFQTCDPAASTKTTADYFVLGTWAQTPQNDLILLDILRTRLEGPDQVNLFKQQYLKWKPAFQGIESAGLGKTIYQMLVREGLPIRELKADTDKFTRALPAAARMEAGAIYFMSGTQWLHTFEEELLSFPNGAHDDQVDVLSYAVSVLISSQCAPNYETSFAGSSFSSGGMRV